MVGEGANKSGDEGSDNDGRTWETNVNISSSFPGATEAAESMVLSLVGTGVPRA
jgi:hypothetical protein